MRVLAVVAVLALVGIDQAVKIWAERVLAGQPDIQLWPGVFHLSYVENRGAAFGMMQGKQMLFVVITIVVLGAIIWYWRQLPHNKVGVWMKVALVLIIAGAIGNLIDRVTIQFVRDMFYFILIDFLVFNVADICVVVGVILLFPLLLFCDAEEKTETPIPPTTPEEGN